MFVQATAYLLQGLRMAVRSKHVKHAQGHKRSDGKLSSSNSETTELECLCGGRMVIRMHCCACLLALDRKIQDRQSSDIRCLTFADGRALVRVLATMSSVGQ
jgi:hypothetical protein